IASLYINDQRVAQADLALTPHEEKRLTFTHTVSRSGRHEGRIEISGDDFAGDNQMYFAFQIPETFNMLIVDNNAGGEYLRLALEPTAAAVRHWRIKRVTADRLGGVQLDDYDVVSLVGLERLSAAEAASLGRFVRRGGGALFVPGPQLTMERFNGPASDFLGVRLAEDLQINPAGSGYYSLEEMDYSHPALQPFGALYESGPPVFEFYSTPRFELEVGARAAARFSGGRPALVEKQLGSGKIITFAGILRPDFTNLMSRSFFVPFVIRLSEYAASDLSRYDYNRRVGDEIITPLPRRVDPTTPLTLTAPDGSSILAQAVEKAGAYELTLPNAIHAGVHELRSRGLVVDQFAVNIHPSEGALYSATLAETGATLGLELRSVPRQQDLAGFLSEQRTGKELWKTLLWLAALLILVEMTLAGDLFGRRAVENEPAPAG
ncbi:MAG TPA: hypothetical protein VLB27_09415, partial [candidate division Zixibacteria bacterium]|nr:hypothetical protein [candidate division Zixibacteria bacterium]